MAPRGATWRRMATVLLCKALKSKIYIVNLSIIFATPRQMAPYGEVWRNLASYGAIWLLEHLSPNGAIWRHLAMKILRMLFFRLCTIATWRYRQVSPKFGEWRRLAIAKWRHVAPRGATWRQIWRQMAPFGEFDGAIWRHLAIVRTRQILAPNGAICSPRGAIWRI